MAEHEELEAIILLPDQAAVEAFRAGEGVLEHPRMHDSASSVSGGVASHKAVKAYAIDDDTVFDMPLTGGRVQVNAAANARMFGNGAAQPRDILSGAVRSPHEFQVNLTTCNYLVTNKRHDICACFGSKASSASTQKGGSRPPGSAL